MTRSASRIAIALLTAVASSCVYSHYSLPPNQSVPNKVTAKDFPDSVEQEAARRGERRRNAIAFGLAELVGGAGLTFLAIKAEPEAPDTGSVAGDLKEGAKQGLGQALLIAAAGTIALVGLGDLVLGGLDGLFRSPFVVGDGAHRRLMTLEEIAAAPPAPSLQLDAHLAIVMSLRGFESQMGLGAFHWLNERVRLRYALTAGLGGRFDTDAVGVSVSAAPEILAELCFGERRKLGRYPGWALGLFASPGWTRLETAGRDHHFAWRAGVALETGRGAVRLGVHQIVGLDRSTAIEVGSVFPISTD